MVGALLGLGVGIGLLAGMRVLAPSLFPQQGALHLGFYVGVLPTSLDGTFSRADYLRMAAWSFAGAVACLGVTVGAASLMSYGSPGGKAERAFEGLFMVLVLVMLLCIAGAVQHVWHAIRWRPRRLASEWAPPEVGRGDEDLE